MYMQGMLVTIKSIVDRYVEYFSYGRNLTCWVAYGLTNRNRRQLHWACTPKIANGIELFLFLEANCSILSFGIVVHSFWIKQDNVSPHMNCFRLIQ